MIYLFGVLVAALIVIFILSYFLFRQKRRLVEMTKDVLEITENRNNKLLFADKNDSIGSLTFEINRLITCYRNEKMNLEKEQRLRKKLIADLSHDVRTPLVSVIGYLEAVVEKRVDDSLTTEYLNTALSKALNLRGQINQLFEFVQCDADEIKLTFERLEVCEILRQVLIGFLPFIEQEKIQLEAKIPDDEIFISADEPAVIRICQNLIRNTLEHGKNGGYIGVSLSSSDHKAVLDIADKGFGIAGEDLPYIFDRLYKADHARARGGGLGLAVAKELTEKMNGEIFVLRSVPGDTVFRVTFPLINEE